MSENRFADCQTVEHVLRSLLPIEPPEVWDALEADALARIRALTAPPVVSEEARERAKTVVYDAMMEARRIGPDVPAAHRWLDRIIDALGYQPAEPREWSVLECLGCGDQISAERYGDHRAKCPRSAEAPASPPVVELDESDLGALSRHLQSWCEFALHMNVPPTARIPICVGEIVQNDGGTWVLRIGGDQ